jgi:hypothetical protein
LALLLEMQQHGDSHHGNVTNILRALPKVREMEHLYDQQQQQQQQQVPPAELDASLGLRRWRLLLLLLHSASACQLHCWSHSCEAAAAAVQYHQYNISSTISAVQYQQYSVSSTVSAAM